MSKITGKVAQIIGPVIDVEFESGTEIPKIYDSLEITKADGSKLVLEVQSHIGENSGNSRYRRSSHWSVTPKEHQRIARSLIRVFSTTD